MRYLPGCAKSLLVCHWIAVVVVTVLVLGVVLSSVL